MMAETNARRERLEKLRAQLDAQAKVGRMPDCFFCSLFSFFFFWLFKRQREKLKNEEEEGEEGEEEEEEEKKGLCLLSLHE